MSLNLQYIYYNPGNRAILFTSKAIKSEECGLVKQRISLGKLSGSDPGNRSIRIGLAASQHKGRKSQETDC